MGTSMRLTASLEAECVLIYNVRCGRYAIPSKKIFKEKFQVVCIVYTPHVHGGANNQPLANSDGSFYTW